MGIGTDGTVVASSPTMIRLRDGAGGEWRYADPVAWDADGEPLDAWFAVEGGALRLEVDDAAARYPVSIDPLVSVASTVLVSADGDDYFGWAADASGDMNGDGYADLLVGAPQALRNRGKVYLYLGSASGLATAPAVTITGGGAANLSEFGFSAINAGDVNGDGLDDALVGGPTYNGERGRVTLYAGAPTGLNTRPIATFTGDQSSESLGDRVAALGDVNHDGYADVAIAAPAYDAVVDGTLHQDGAVFVYLGAPGTLSATPALTVIGTGDEYLGLGVAGAGDVNGDGYDDMLIGAPEGSTGTGRAMLYLGSAAGLGPSPALEIAGVGPYSFCGFNVTGLGDVNGDGYADWAIGSDYEDTTGAIRVYFGGSTPDGTADVVLTPGPAGAMVAGHSVASAGDVNGDGYDDLVWGDIHSADTWGQVYLHEGSAFGPSMVPTETLTGPSSGSFFGWYLWGSGDVNGDGLSDVVVGAVLSGGYPGSAYVYMGYTEIVDADGDGFDTSTDCDDTDASRHPGATEICNGLDDDCNGLIDDGSIGSVWYRDVDGDGYGQATPRNACSQPSGFSATAGDCNDANSAIHPGAMELCNGVDDNCNRRVDEARGCH